MQSTNQWKLPLFLAFPSSPPFLQPLFVQPLYYTEQENSQFSRNNFQNNGKQIRMDGKHLIFWAPLRPPYFQETPSSTASEFSFTILRITYISGTIFRFDKSGLVAAHRLGALLFSLQHDKAMGNLLQHISA